MVYIPQAKLTLEQIESEQARVIHVRTNKSVQETILRMALCTSTPKSKLLETASLLSLDSENEGMWNYLEKKYLHLVKN